MLKKVKLLGLALVMGLGVVGCSGAKTEDAAKIKDIATIKTELESSELLQQSHASVDAKEHYIFENNLDKVKEGFIDQALINVKLQDVIVVEAVDEAGADALVADIENYKENALRMFATGYGGEENATSVANSKLEKVGNVVYFIACEKADEVEKLILGN